METEVKVSQPPVFDFEKAILAQEATWKEGYASPPNVRTAGILWLYNTPSERWPQIFAKLKILSKKESNAANPKNPLPTIGWEVESPSYPFKREMSGRYALFFDLICLPRNTNHTNVVPGNPDTYTARWEFSSAPSYSSAVASRTLCELIKGDFIPHLLGPSTAQDRGILLDEKLVSLHINLGIPSWAYDTVDEKPSRENKNFLLLASAFELAYTSSERFLHRSQISVVADYKKGEQTAKSNMSDVHRLEVKALEVSDSRTYRLMDELQLMATAVFCDMGKRDPSLARIWKKTSNKLQNIYTRHNIDSSIVTDKSKVSSLIEETAIQRKLRKILTESSHKVRSILNSFEANSYYN